MGFEGCCQCSWFARIVHRGLAGERILFGNEGHGGSFAGLACISTFLRCECKYFESHLVKLHPSREQRSKEEDGVISNDF